METFKEFTEDWRELVAKSGTKQSLAKYIYNVMDHDVDEVCLEMERLRGIIDGKWPIVPNLKKQLEVTRGELEEAKKTIRAKALGRWNDGDV